MPLYGFKCQSCGHGWEVLSKDPAETPTSCPLCSGNEIKRLLPLTNIHKGPSRNAGRTCCGREERCQVPPCSSGDCRH